MPAPSQRRALGGLFLVLTAAFAGIAATAASGHAWPVAGAAAVLALWLASLTWQMLRPRN